MELTKTRLRYQNDQFAFWDVPDWLWRPRFLRIEEMTITYPNGIALEALLVSRSNDE
jgi:hypothetical protein